MYLLKTDFIIEFMTLIVIPALNTPEKSKRKRAMQPCHNRCPKTNTDNEFDKKNGTSSSAKNAREGKESWWRG